MLGVGGVGGVDVVVAVGVGDLKAGDRNKVQGARQRGMLDPGENGHQEPQDVRETPWCYVGRGYTPTSASLWVVVQDSRGCPREILADPTKIVAVDVAVSLAPGDAGMEHVGIQIQRDDHPDTGDHDSLDAADPAVQWRVVAHELLAEVKHVVEIQVPGVSWATGVDSVHAGDQVRSGLLRLELGVALSAHDVPPLGDGHRCPVDLH